MQRICGFRTTDRKIKALIVPPLLTSFLTLLIVMGSQLLFLMSHEGQRIVPEKPLQDKAHSVANSVARTEEPEPWNIRVMIGKNSTTEPPMFAQLPRLLQPHKPVNSLAVQAEMNRISVVCINGCMPLGSVDAPCPIHLGKPRDGHVSSPQGQILCFRQLFLI